MLETWHPLVVLAAVWGLFFTLLPTYFIAMQFTKTDGDWFYLAWSWSIEITLILCIVIVWAQLHLKVV